MREVLILSLGRKGGSVRYAKEIIDRINISADVYVSKYCLEALPKSHREIITYKNKVQFVTSTFFLLPLFLCRILTRLVRGQYKTLYLPYYQYWSIPVIYLFKLFNRKVVITVHDGLLHTGDGYPFEQFLNKVYIRKGDSVIFLTEYVQKMVNEHIPFAGISHIIPHGIIRPIGIVCRKRELPEKPVILFLGRINRYKGIDLLIDAVSQLPSDMYEKLIIAGKSSYELPVLKEIPKIEL